MRISDLSKATGVSQRMLRYYEEVGLLSPARSQGEYRVYSKEHVIRVLEIRELQRLGLALKEISALFEEPQNAEPILQAVYAREKMALIEKQKSLMDLKERFLHPTTTSPDTRVAYRVPNLELILKKLPQNECLLTEYMRMADWPAHVSNTLLIGEIIWQSSFYLLSSTESDRFSELEGLMRDFCKSAARIWKHFDGHPPHAVASEDIHEFLAPNEIVIVLTFKDQSQIILPYSSIYALAKASEAVA